MSGGGRCYIIKKTTNMTRYISTSGKQSGVIEYELGDEYIMVRFVNNKLYRYTYNTAGSNTVEKMKNLAKASLGLNTFISRFKPKI
ncbi:MAG: hypothetical protein KBF59_00450 [Ignavibacterium sp.]|jgi:hypothetical protein|nr:hypothetical protein [Ignavibacterium sp.]